VAHVHEDQPATLLVEHIDLLATAPDKTALDVACGKGRNALFLARKGFAVTGLDRDAGGLADARAQAEAKHLSVTLREQDLEADGATLPEAAFGLVCVFYFLHRPLLAAIAGAVRPGGFLAYETFLIDGHLRWGQPQRREFTFDHNELLDAFRPGPAGSGFRVHLYHERVDERARTARVQLIAQRV
jgi:tellurite methyltransferase